MLSLFVLYFVKGSTNGGRWIWNNLSTMSSQIIDTVVFIGIAFGIGFGWIFDSEQFPNLLIMMISYYIFKFCIALIDTPVFYILTNKNDNNNLQNGIDKIGKL